jgi:hypothetical protein
MASAKQKAAAKKNIKKAQAANRARHGHHKPGPKKGSHKKKKKTTHHPKKSGHRAKKKNPSKSTALMMNGGAPGMTNPSPQKRKKKRNPSGGKVVDALKKLALTTGGAVVGVGAARLADMFIPVSNGWLAAIEGAAAFTFGGLTYLVSPAAGAGVFVGLAAPAAMKGLDMIVPAKAASTTPPQQQSGSALGAIEVLNLAPGMKLVPKGGRALGRVEVSMGAVEIIADTPQQLAAVRELRGGQRVLVSGSDVNRIQKARGY